jgi:hypothetical protein
MADHKVPICNIEAEVAVIGSILIDNQIFKQISDVINYQDFYYESHRIIYKAITEVIESEKVIDSIILNDYLKNVGSLDKCGGISYISSLTDNVPSTLVAKHYADIIKEKSLLRQLIKVGNDIVTKTSNPSLDLSSLLPEIQQAIVTIVTKKGSKNAKKTIQQEVEEWVHSNKSNNDCYYPLLLSLLSCYYDLGYTTKMDKASCRMAFKRLCEKGVLEPQGGKSGMYRYLNGACDVIDYINAEDEPYDWHCPLGTHQLVKIYPGSVILIAGETNAGKTGYLLNVARYYRDSRAVYYFSSEMEDVELKARLKNFNLPLESWKNVRFISKYANFQEAIKPNQLNIIDYLEVHKDFYEVSGLIRAIKDKIERGIVIIAIQKPTGRDEGVGGQNTKNLSRLYIALSPGKAKIVKGKMWASLINPDGMCVDFKLGGGCNFVLKQNWYKDAKTPF